MTALEGFDVGGAVWLDDEAGDGLNPRCSYHWLSTWYLNGLAFPASTVHEWWHKYGLNIAWPISALWILWRIPKFLNIETEWFQSHQVPSSTDPLHSQEPSGLWALRPRLDRVSLGWPQIWIHFEWETIPFQGYHLFSNQIPVAVWRLPPCVVRSLRMSSSEPRPSYRPTFGDGLEDWIGPWMVYGFVKELRFQDFDASFMKVKGGIWMNMVE